MGAKVSDEIEAVVMKKFGDEQSSLLDKFERLTFEAHLNKAMRLGRSLSEPGTMALRANLPPSSAAGQPPKNFSAQLAASDLEFQPVVRPGWRSRRRSAAVLKNAVRKLLGTIGFGSGKKQGFVISDPKDPRFWKDFSRSMRF